MLLSVEVDETVARATSIERVEGYVDLLAGFVSAEASSPGRPSGRGGARLTWECREARKDPRCRLYAQHRGDCPHIYKPDSQSLDVATKWVQLTDEGLPFWLARKISTSRNGVGETLGLHKFRASQDSAAHGPACARLSLFFPDEACRDVSHCSLRLPILYGPAT